MKRFSLSPDLFKSHTLAESEAGADDVLLEVDADRCVEVASQLFANLPVRDISIWEPPLESIIEALYLQG